jgi:hypothetical protein
MTDGHGAWLEAVLAVKAWFLEHHKNTYREVREEMVRVFDKLIDGGTIDGWDPNIVTDRHRGVIGGDSGFCVHLKTTAPRHGALYTRGWSGVYEPHPDGSWSCPWEIKLYKPFTPETF